MSEKLLGAICPLPWVHLSAHLDSTARLCCNTGDSGFVKNNKGKNFKISEIKSVQDYFNLEYYKNIRKQMINGLKPKECSSCYRIESFGGTSVRQGYLQEYLNNEQWASQLVKTNKLTGEVTAQVQSLDFSLSNNCNLKCIMCSPAASFAIKNDYDVLRLAYDSTFVEGARNNWTDITAIDRLIPDIAGDLRTFLTTGGEPFLSREHFRILELLVKSGNASKIRLNYHTNCTVYNEKLFDIWNHFEAVSIHFSIDAYGKLNEYIRFKTKWEDVEKNVKAMLAHPKTSCEVHTTVQLLNIFNLNDLYDWMKPFDQMPKLPYHIWMNHPTWLHISKVLPLELKQEAKKKLVDYFDQKLINDSEYSSRSQHIISYLDRAINEEQNGKDLKQFKQLIRQFEKLRQTPAIDTLVPELKTLFS